MKMVFIEGGHDVNITRRNAQKTSGTPNIQMPTARRDTPSKRFDMGQSMKLKKTGCRSCSGVR